jgi:hemerythrin superfamily protein
MTSEQVSSTASRLLAGLVSHDAISILREDHRRVEDLFRQFERLRDEAARGEMANRICVELLIHAHIENEIFYPAVREAIDDADLMDEADIEHAALAALITDIMNLRPGARGYGARVKVLGDYVRHHVQEEQNRMFSKARQARLDMRALGEQMLERKAELRDTFRACWQPDLPLEGHAAPEPTATHLTTTRVSLAECR